MNMKEMGQNLRLGRERMGLSVEDVVQRTKISKVNIVALEAGDVEALPHPVYAKGFVRNYAKLLGLDAEAYAEVLGREFLVEDNVAPPQPEGEAPAEPSQLAEGEGGRLKVLLAGLVLLGCIVGAVVYMYSGKGGETATQEAPVAVEPAPAAPAAPAAPEAAAPAEEPQPEPAAETPQPQAAAEEAVSQAQAVADAEASAVEEAVSQAPAATMAPPVQEAAAEADADHDALADDGRQRVLIKAEEPCWILATVDGGQEQGGVLVDIMLQPGQTKLLRYSKTMVVKLGNAGGVHITLNGEPFDFDAKSGQVRTLNFPEG